MSISARIMGRTETMSLRVQSLYEEPAGETAAFAIAALLALLALITLGLKTWVEWKTEKNYERAQKTKQNPRSAIATPQLIS